MSVNASGQPQKAGGGPRLYYACVQAAVCDVNKG